MWIWPVWLVREDWSLVLVVEVWVLSIRIIVSKWVSIAWRWLVWSIVVSVVVVSGVQRIILLIVVTSIQRMLVVVGLGMSIGVANILDGIL